MKESLVVLIGFFPDPRFANRINTAKQLADLHLICWDRGYSKLPEPIASGYTAHIIRVKAKGDPIRRFIPYKKFAGKAMTLLKQIKPKVIHVQNLDMLQIAIKYKKKCDAKLKIIYEVADLHTLIIDKQKNPLRKIAQKYLIAKDREYSKVYNKLILTSEAFYDVYFSDFVSKKNVIYMPNMPDVSSLLSYVPKDHGTNFTVGYIGAIRYKKQMRNLIEAAKKTNTKLLIAGFEEGTDEIEQLCKDSPDVEWIGRFDFKQRGAELYGKCDLMYSVYDADMANVRVALPNKLYEAAWCEIPLIVAKNTYLAELVERWGTGIAVDHSSSSDLAGKLEEIKVDRDKYDRIVNNCREKKKTINYQFYEDTYRNSVRELLASEDNK